MARAVLPVAVAVAVALVLLMSSVAVRAADALLLLDRAEFVTSDSPEPPPDAAPWQAQALRRQDTEATPAGQLLPSVADFIAAPAVGPHGRPSPRPCGRSQRRRAVMR